MNADRAKSYVLFPMGANRFALPAEFVEELARPDHLQTFPHRTPLLTGVLVRRGKIVPVCDIAQVLVGADAPPRKFYLIANQDATAHREWTAIPVTGECALASLEPSPPEAGQPPYVTGLVKAGDEKIAVVDLSVLISPEVTR